MKKSFLYLLLAVVFVLIVGVGSLIIAAQQTDQSQSSRPVISQNQKDQVVDRSTSLSEKSSVSAEPPTLTHLETYAMQVGTHRPEILFDSDNDRVYLLMVYPDVKNGVQHQGLIFNASDTEDFDFNTPIKQFPVSWVTDEYGSGADHRAAIVGDELWVIVQSIVLDPAKNCAGGPSEPCAISQHLLLSRFDLDGELIATVEIANTNDVPEDSYPDMSVLVDGDTLLVSTGSVFDGTKSLMKIRRINADGEILETYTYQTSQTGIPGSIGNSLFWTPDGEIVVFSGTFDQVSYSLLNDQFNVSRMSFLDLPDDENSFQTGVAYQSDYYYVGYSARDTGEIAIEQNPLSPRLMLLSSDFDVVETVVVSEEAGAGHVHPTMVIIGNKLLYTWSKKSGTLPQVHIEQFELE